MSIRARLALALTTLLVIVAGLVIASIALFESVLVSTIVAVVVVAGGAAVGWIVVGRMLAPLDTLARAMQRATHDAFSRRVVLAARHDGFGGIADGYESLRGRLEAQEAEQRRFAANASHELRTPLAITRALLDVARSDPNQSVTALVERLHTVNTRAISLTEAMLLLSRTDRASFIGEPVDVSLLTEEAAEELLPLAEKRGVAIETAGDVGIVMGSYPLLQQLVTNLVHNAIVHNLPENGTVQIVTAVRPETITVTIESTGEVLDPASVTLLIEPFRRGTERVSSDHAGVGLGLAIVRSIAHAHEGTLALQARADGGLTVIVELPRLTDEGR